MCWLYLQKIKQIIGHFQVMLSWVVDFFSDFIVFNSDSDKSPKKNNPRSGDIGKLRWTSNIVVISYYTIIFWWPWAVFFQRPPVRWVSPTKVPSPRALEIGHTRVERLGWTDAGKCGGNHHQSSMAGGTSIWKVEISKNTISLFLQNRTWGRQNW